MISSDAGNYPGSWIVWVVSAEGPEARQLIRGKINEVHPNPWDHVEVLEP